MHKCHKIYKKLLQNNFSKILLFCNKVQNLALSCYLKFVKSNNFYSISDQYI